MSQPNTTSPWNFNNPALDFDHKYKGYLKEIKTLSRYTIKRAIGRCSMPQVRFVIFGRGRSGSSLLVNLLDQHSEISCLGEILRSRLIAPEAHRDRCLSMASKRVRGFKLLSYQVTQVMNISPESGYIERMANDGFRVIYVYRRNHFRLAISNIYARLSGRFHKKAGEDDHFGTSSYVFPPADVLAWMEGAAARTAEEREMLRNVDFLDVQYERNLEATEQQALTMRQACDWLGVKHEITKSKLDKITPPRVQDIVANFDEVFAHVKHSQFGEFLDET